MGFSIRLFYLILVSFFFFAGLLIATFICPTPKLLLPVVKQS